MRLVFRPATPRAGYLRKRAHDIARAMTGRVLTRVEDGFLLRAVAMDDAVTVTVIDLPGEIFIPFETDYSLSDWSHGVFLKFDGNPTDALFAKEGPFFELPATVEHIGPKRYIKEESGADWGAGRASSTGMAHNVAGGAVIAARLTGPIGATVPTRCTVQRTRAGSLSRETPYSLVNGALPDDDQVLSAAGTMLFEFDLSAFQFGSRTALGIVGVGQVDPLSGYVVAIGRVTEEAGSFVLGDDVLSIARYTLREPDDDHPVAWLQVDNCAAISLDDLPSDDVPDDIPVVPDVRPAPTGWTLQSIDGDYNTSAAAPSYSRSNAWADAPRVAWRRSSLVLTSPRLETRAYPICVHHEGAVYILATAHSRLEVERIAATIRNTSTGALLPVELVDQRAAEQRVTYLIRVDADGTKTMIRVAKNITATHDPRWRSNNQVELYPLYAHGGPYFVCIRQSLGAEVLTPVGVGAAAYFKPTPMVRADDIDLVVISADGGLVEVQSGDLYPVHYATIDGRTAEVPDQYVGGESCRLNYGQYDLVQILAGLPLEFSRASPVCNYAPGFFAAVMAPRSSFTDAQQSASVAVFRVSDGVMVAQSPALLQFEVEDAFRDGEVQRWNLSCVEEAEVDELGDLVGHAVLLLLRTSRKGASAIYRMDNLEIMVQIGTAPSMAGGPAYYMGTPLAPAIVGQSVNRPFFGGSSNE